MNELQDSNKYVILDINKKLHIFKDYYLIKDKETIESIKISQSLCNLIKEFDGAKKLEDLIETWLELEIQYKTPQTQLCKDILMLSSLIICGVVKCYTNKMPNSIPIIRNDLYYYPESIHVELTSKCNFKCFYCYRNSESSINEEQLPTNLLKDILNGLASRGLQVVELTGGEPLLHPDFLNIVFYCAETFRITSVLTNGYLLSQDIVDSLLSYRDRIIFGISLDSYRPAEHDRRCCTKGAFKKVTENIKILTSAGFTVRIAMVVDEDNWDDLESTLIFSQQLGAKSFTYSSVLPFGRGDPQDDGFKFWKLNDSNVIFELEKGFNEKYSEFLDKLDSNQLDSLSKRGSCGAGHRTYAMDPIGNIRLCVTFDVNDAIIGNLANQTPEEVFSNKLCELSAQLIAPSIASCSPCPYAMFCNNCVLRGSRALNFIGKENCKWAQTAEVSQWLDLVRLHSNSDK